MRFVPAGEGLGTVDQITYRKATEEQSDIAAFCDLYNGFYAKNVDDRYVRWQFFDTPFPSILSVAANEANHPIGFYGLHVIETNAGLMTAWVLDIMIHPSYQDRGVFRNLAQFAHEQIRPFQPAGIFVMANETGANALTRGLGWSQINTYISFVAETKKTREFPSDPQITIIETHSLELDYFGEHFHNRGLCLIQDDLQYRRWRYNENPRFRYSQFKAIRNGEVFGYLVLKIFTDPVTAKTFGDIVDIRWHKDNASGLTQMLLFALNYFRQRQVRLAVMWLQSNTILDQVGLDLGFRRIDQNRYFCGMALKPEHKSLELPESWFLTLSASEIY